MLSVIFRWLPLVLVWSAVVYRARNAHRSRAGLYVWLTMLTIAVALTLDVPEVRRLVQHEPNLSNLVKYVLVLTSALCASEALALLPAAADLPSRSRTAVRGGWLIAVLGMIVSWLIAPVHSTEAEQFTETYAGYVELIPLWACYLGYLGWLMVTLARDQFAYRSLPSSPIRTGMLMISAGAVAGLGYVLQKAAYLVAVFTVGKSAAEPVGADPTTMILLGSSVLLLVGGILWPVLARARGWLDSIVTYHALEPLWRTVTSAAPQVVLTDARARTFAERTEGRLVEIRDGLSSLPPVEGTDSAATSEPRHRAIVALRRAGADLGLDLATVSTTTFDLEPVDDTAHLRRLSQALSRLDRGSSPLDRLARRLTDALAPAYLIMVAVLLVAWSEAGLVAGLGWAALTLLFAPGIPLAFVVLGVRRHWWSDRHVRVRGQRFVPLSVALVSVLTGIVVLRIAAAPTALVALIVDMIAGLVVALSVTTVWKVSIHTAVAAGNIVIFAYQLGTICAVLAAIATLGVGWSRCRLRDHTIGQAVAGAALGAAVAEAVFATMVGSAG